MVEDYDDLVDKLEDMFVGSVSNICDVKDHCYKLNYLLDEFLRVVRDVSL